MMNDTKKTNRQNSLAATIQGISKRKRASMFFFVLLLVLYFLTSVVRNAISNSDDVLMLFGNPVPTGAFTGVIASIANTFIIFLVVFYGKLGFFTSLALLVIHFPIIINGMIHSHNLTSIPGLFSNLFTIFAIWLLYHNNVKIDNYQQRLREQAVTDLLTGLPNRFACTELISELVEEGKPFAIVSIDLNNFKSINDTMGHDTGNAVLIEVANRWKNVAENSLTETQDFIARQGGDEFVLIIRGYRSDGDILNTIRSYESILENRITVDGYDYYIAASFGYAEFPKDAKTADSLFSYSDAAMYEVKRLGSSNHILRFTPDLLKDEHTLEMERIIRYALDNDKVRFHLQPQYTIEHRLRGFESLARIEDQNGKLLNPTSFIPVAEKVGLVDKIDSAVFRSSMQFLGEMIKKTGTGITVSVNVSVRHLMKTDFLDEVRSNLETYHIPPQQLEIEITESVMIDSAEKALDCINAIKDMGIKIAIDDFGTGYSSLSYLNKVPADLLKIDKSFIDKMNSSDSSKKYVAAIISIGHIMNFDVISEGVEETDQLDTLRGIGCDFIQGFIWGKPLPPEEAAKLVYADAQMD
ncbi:MAG: bifunctional diguanylate cyclase/phosphodiesterase [Oscillospiraceae bacterium]|nr:bifunctional diguanylate cyclase/phosphodiesterase [Oscillospiraceae bacterium]